MDSGICGRARELIERLSLTAHPEGGYYRESYRSTMKLSSPAAGAKRSALTDIYFMLPSGELSRFHRVRHDEVWNFYEGAPLTLHLLEPDGTFMRTLQIGPLDSCEELKTVVPAGCWQAAESTGEYSLVGCSVAPGFEFEDFEFLADCPEAGQRLVDSASSLERLL